MGSFFINAGLVAGVALAAIPVILHLFMRQTPKHVVFPALRLIRQRQERTTKRLRIKNWLLLLARMGLLALMALALARPRMDAKIQAGDADVESAMALVFDTSLSMGYSERAKSRLEEAKELAAQLLQRTNANSDIFVIDSGRVAEPTRLSPAVARQVVGSLELVAANQTLNQALSLGAKTVAASSKPRREVFVFGDLSLGSWGTNQGVDLGDAESKSVGIYLMNLGPQPKDRHDVAITGLEPDESQVGQDEALPIRVSVRASGKPAKRVVAFYVDGERRDQKLIEVPADGEVQTPAFTPRFGPGLHRVDARLEGEPDPVPWNDAYFATFEVRPAAKVLLIADRAADVFYVANALEPEILREQADAARPFRVDQMLTSQLEGGLLQRGLQEYSCVFLLNVERPARELWQALGAYVRRGGGLVIGVGDRVAADLDAYNSTPEARELMPATLEQVRTHRDFSFGRADVSSGLFARYTNELLAELSRVPIFKTLLASPIGDARTLLWYQDDTPALIERGVTGEGRPGRVLLWTTDLKRVPRVESNWNEFPIAYWSFFQLMNQTVPYLSGSAGPRLTIEAGDSVTLPLESGRRTTDINAQPPGQVPPIRLNEPTDGRPLVVSTRAPNLKVGDMLGHWQVTTTQDRGPGQTLGFSVNAPASESDAAVIDAATLDALIGKDRYKVASDLAELKRQMSETIVGRELFPWLMFALLLLVTLENALANLFYRERPNVAPALPTRTVATAARG